MTTYHYSTGGSPAEADAQAGAQSEPRTAFVFQGGGSLTAPQVGMLRALSEAGLRPDLVVGSSAGALNAVAYAHDSSPVGLEQLNSVWMSLRRRSVAPFSARVLFGALTGRVDGLVSAAGLQRVLTTGLVPRLLSDTQIPAYVVATELDTAEPVVLSDTETVSALLATCAFPGLYPPVAIGGRLLIDGGVAADIPVLQAEALGAERTFVLPAAVADDANTRPRGPLSSAYHALGQILDGVSRRDAALARGEVHLLPAPTSNASTPVDFRDTARLIDDGYRLASAWLADFSTAGRPTSEQSAATESTTAVDERLSRRV